MKKVFLGGTCSSKWRDAFISTLKIDYYNPVVDDWTPSAQQEEDRQKKLCQYHLYVVTPNMEGIFSIAELIDDSNKIKNHTIICFLKEDVKDGVVTAWTPQQERSIAAVVRMARYNGAICLPDLKKVTDWLNSVR